MSLTGSVPLVPCHHHDDLSKVSLFAYKTDVHALIRLRLMLVLAERLGICRARLIFFDWTLLGQ